MMGHEIEHRLPVAGHDDFLAFLHETGEGGKLPLCFFDRDRLHSAIVAAGSYDGEAKLDWMGTSGGSAGYLHQLPYVLDRTTARRARWVAPSPRAAHSLRPRRPARKPTGRHP